MGFWDTIKRPFTGPAREAEPVAGPPKTPVHDARMERLREERERYNTQHPLGAVDTSGWVIRDQIKRDMGYWLEYVRKEEYMLESFGKSLREPCDEAKTKRLRARYSMGAPVAALQDDAIDYIEGLCVDYADKVYPDKRMYVSFLLPALCVALLLEVPDDAWNGLCEILRGREVDDWLLCYIMAARGGEPVPAEMPLRIERPYAHLKELVYMESREQQEQLRLYCAQKFYRGHGHMAWYNSHNNKNDVYCGYWSFEAAAVAKILGLDDSGMEKQKYYLYDMVHFTQA